MAGFVPQQPGKAISGMGVKIKRHSAYDRLGCPVEITTEIIGGKWKGKIIYILLSGTKRFGELRRLVGTATQRMLTNQLRELERDGVVKREAYVETPPKVEYSLTELGQKLRPAIEAMCVWGKMVHDGLDRDPGRAESIGSKQ
jgi:DNA-binding HxlR family transcriptional regulator